MTRFPPEFEALLSPKGRRVLRGPPFDRFASIPGVLDARKAAACGELLERVLGDELWWMDEPIPPETISSMTESYTEALPKTVRVRTALLGSRRAKAYRAAEESGLVRMLRSESFGAFASALAGRKLKRRWGIQALRYGPGDYSGPHNDHDPEEPDARDGYLDVHLSFSTGVAHQWLVYEQDGHLCEIADIATTGGLTAYRLPLWHYTTPLVARRGVAARRWVLLGTFLFG